MQPPGSRSSPGSAPAKAGTPDAAARMRQCTAPPIMSTLPAGIYRCPEATAGVGLSALTPRAVDVPREHMAPPDMRKEPFRPQRSDRLVHVIRHTADSTAPQSIVLVVNVLWMSLESRPGLRQHGPERWLRGERVRSRRPWLRPETRTHRVGRFTTNIAIGCNAVCCDRAPPHQRCRGFPALAHQPRPTIDSAG
jgi:hypothetical protein